MNPGQSRQVQSTSKRIELSSNAPRLRSDAKMFDLLPKANPSRPTPQPPGRFPAFTTGSLMVLGLLGLWGCAPTGSEQLPGQGSGITTNNTSDTGVPDTGAFVPVGHCTYTSRFTKAMECKAYTGQQWTIQSATQDCATQQASAFTQAQACPVPNALGRCVVTSEPGQETQTHSYGPDGSGCSDLKFGCETFARGQWFSMGACLNPGADDPQPKSQGIVPATRNCVDPLPGQAPGQSPGGKVCTWESISGSTENGRRFEDYASCEKVRSQGRPYFPYPIREGATQADPRLDDPSYLTELNWVKSQIEASSCVCCHSEKAPQGPSNWYLEQPGNFMNGFFDRGLTFGSHWLDSSSFGAYKPEENNGFERVISGFPSVDGPRMKRFFEQELAHRGLTRENFKDAKHFGGPMHDQRFYQPEPCEPGQGVAADGTISWTGGPARYIYVLKTGSLSPTAPPYLDLPEGTMWRADVDPYDPPVASNSVKYGVTDTRLTQTYPYNAAAPEPLLSGTSYYLYVTKDVIAPITRCTFVAP